MKTHIGCIIYTLVLYSGSALLGKYIALTGNVKIIMAIIDWAFCMMMIKSYAPADTENVPILMAKERKQKQIFSYIILTIEIVISIFINNTILLYKFLYITYFQIL